MHTKINKFNNFTAVYSHPHCTLSFLINLHDVTRLHEHTKHTIMCTIISLNSQLDISILYGRIQKPKAYTRKWNKKGSVNK